jgi:hypothetical protein
LDRLNEAFHYILKNESSRNIILVHLYERMENNEEKAIKKALVALKQIFPVLNVDFVVKQGKFGPQMVDALFIIVALGGILLLKMGGVNGI